MANLNEIRRVYDAMDENADGRVTVDEICGFINKLGLPMSKDDVKCMVIPLSSRQDYTLLFEEFVQFYHSILNSDDDDEELEGLMEAFRVFDRNNDGYISCSELQQVLSAMGLIPLGQHPQHCQNMIFRFGSDSDGLLDFSEFKTMMFSKLSP